MTLLVSACAGNTDKKVIAEIENQKIYFEDVDKIVQHSIYEYLFAINEVRDIALNQLIDDRLLNIEADSRLITIDSLLASKLSDFESTFPLDRYVRENALRSGVVDPERPFELISIDSKRGRTILLESYQHFLRREYLNSLRIKYHVKIHLDPPESPAIDFAGISKQTRGNQTSTNSLSIIYNFSCNVCQQKEPIFRRLFQKYKGKVRFNYYLLSPEVEQKILFANCAGKLGKFWAAYEAINSIESQDSIFVEHMAKTIGLDYAKCIKCMNNPKTHNEISDNMAKLRELKIEVTPTILINNHIYYGEVSEFAISQELNKHL